MEQALSISICIPTYNRAKFLLELLDSIHRETDALIAAHPSLAGLVEVCISDNASTDSTESDVRAWAPGKAVSVHFKRQATNIGPDRNYLAAASLASHDYIWLMGSDDTLREGALQRVLQALRTRPTFVLGNRMNCSFTMAPRHPVHWLSANGDRDFDFGSREQLVDYLRQSTSLGAVFSYLSSIVVQRQAWNSAETDPGYIGSAYVHVQKCLLLLMRGATLRYLHEPIVNNRGENDSFESAGAVNRVLIDLRGYTRLSAILADEPRAQSALLGILARERPSFHTAFYLRRNGSAEQWQEGRVLLRQYNAHPVLLWLLDRCPAITRWLSSPAIRGWARRIFGRRTPGKGAA